MPNIYERITEAQLNEKFKSTMRFKRLRDAQNLSDEQYKWLRIRTKLRNEERDKNIDVTYGYSYNIKYYKIGRIYVMCMFCNKDKCIHDCKNNLRIYVCSRCGDATYNNLGYILCDECDEENC